jgi:hypothetical protein
MPTFSAERVSVTLAHESYPDTSEAELDLKHAAAHFGNFRDIFAADLHASATIADTLEPLCAILLAYSVSIRIDTYHDDLISINAEKVG